MAITTNKEYLTATLGRFNVSESDIDVLILDHPELEGTLNVAACKNAMYTSFSAILPVANVSEGGYSVSWNMDGLKLWYKSLCKELGKPNILGPRVHNMSNLW